MVPIEAVAVASMRILEEHGAVTIPAVGMPGAARTFRIMMYPDGARFGRKRALEAWRTGMEAVTGTLENVGALGAVLLGAKGLFG